MRITFFLPMIPPTVTAQEHRITGRHGQKAQIYNTPQLNDAKQKFLAYLAQHAPEAPMEGAVRLMVKWCFPMRKNSFNGQYKTTRPDTDNLQKLFKDCMTKTRFFHDDAQVASEIIEKFYTATPGIFVDVMEISEEEPM